LASIAAQDGQAIIISSVPPFKDCVESWAVRYRTLIQQYQHVVRATFSGHTSEEAIAVTQALYQQNPVNIGLNFVTGSLSPYTGGNPSFAVIELDAEFFIPVSYKTYSIDL